MWPLCLVRLKKWKFREVESFVGGHKTINRTPFYTQFFWFWNSLDPVHLYINMLLILMKRISSLYQTSLPPTTLLFAPICCKTSKMCLHSGSQFCWISPVWLSPHTKVTLSPCCLTPWSFPSSWPSINKSTFFAGCKCSELRPHSLTHSGFSPALLVLTSLQPLNMGACLMLLSVHLSPSLLVTGGFVPVPWL